MLSSLRQRLHNDEDGFTLIELMVVVLIIAILIAIAIPTFLGVQDKAKDSSAKSDLRNSITNAKAIATDFASSTVGVTATAMTTAEPALVFGTAGKGVVGVTNTAGTPDSVLFVTQSDSNKWFGMRLTSDSKVTSCSSSSSANDITAANCDNQDFAGI